MGTVGSVVRTFEKQRRTLGWRGALAERLYSLLSGSPSFVDAVDMSAAIAGPDPIDMSAASELADVHARVDALEASVRHAHQAALTMLWLTNAPLSTRPLVSIVLPTAFPCRLEWLQSAIASVLSQSYTNWELVIVDDAPHAFLTGEESWWPQEARIRLLRSGGVGCGAARNVGIRHALGDIIAHLDDDCRYFPWWLHAAVATFEVNDGANYAFGLRVLEGPDGQPNVLSDGFDPTVLKCLNPADTNVIVHRRVAPMRFPEDVTSCVDYFAVASTPAEQWVQVMVPAATYGQNAPNRIWRPEREAENLANHDRARAAARAARPLRVVGFNPYYPLNSETYIGDELLALKRAGVEVAIARSVRATNSAPAQAPEMVVFDDFEEAVRIHRPDLVLFHWATNAVGNRDRLLDHQLPFAVRSHSFDKPYIPQVLNDPLCIGVWQVSALGTDPHPALFQLPTLIAGSYELGSAIRPQAVVIATASLPKRGLADFLIPALDVLAPEVPITLALGGTDGWANVVAGVVDAVRTRSSIQVLTDVPHREVQALLRSSAVAVYTVNPGEHIGQPRSVIEAALAGCDLVLPDEPELREMVGDRAHFFVRGDQLSLEIALLDAIKNPLSWSDRVDLAGSVRERHFVQHNAETFADTLTGALYRWKRAHPTTAIDHLARWWATGV